MLAFDDYHQRLDANGKETGTTGSDSILLYGDDFLAENRRLRQLGRAGGAGRDRLGERRPQLLPALPLPGVSGHALHLRLRQLYEDCYIEGTVDFIFGSSTAWFERCTLVGKRGGFFTAASTPDTTRYGYVFSHCRWRGAPDAPAGSFYLGRPWRPYAKVVYLACELGAVVRPAGWDEWGDDANEKTAYYAEYQSSGPGANPGARVPWSHQFTAAGSTSAVIGAYNLLEGGNAYGTRLALYFPLDTDELISSPGIIDGGRRSIARYRAFSTNSEITNPWIRLYQGVERANICIAIPTSPIYNTGVAADTATMHRLYGEALALRAQFYLELVRNWGDVPAQFTPTVTGQDVNLPNADRNVTLKHLLDDLAVAEKLLPWRSASGYNSQRFTRGAVKALRARVALQRGGYALQGTVMTRPADYLDHEEI